MQDEVGWLGGIFSGLAGKDTTDWTLIDGLADPGLGIAGKPIAADECYVEIYVESLRLKKARKFATSFHGVVYSFARLAQEAGEDAQLAAISKPDELAKMDPANLDRVITMSTQMMGAVPWRGGPLRLELGLFCVKSGNLLSPLLDYVTRVSSIGGISYIGQVKPFLPLITEGMDLIAGQSQDVTLEVAVHTSMTLQASRLCAVIAVPKNGVTAANLSLDPSDRKLLLNGQPLKEAYCVFSIRCTDQKADYGAIPEIRTAWAALKTGILSADVKQADTAMQAFRRTVLVSADLITRDKNRLIKKAQEMKDAAFPAGPGLVSREFLRPNDLSKIDLADLQIYD